MKTGSLDVARDDGLLGAGGLHAPIVDLAEVAGTSTPEAQAAGASVNEGGVELLRRARAFAEPLLSGQSFETGEDALVHADGVAAILHGIGASPSLRAASYWWFTSLPRAAENRRSVASSSRCTALR